MSYSSSVTLTVQTLFETYMTFVTNFCQLVYEFNCYPCCCNSECLDDWDCREVSEC